MCRGGVGGGEMLREISLGIGILLALVVQATCRDVIKQNLKPASGHRSVRQGAVVVYYQY